MTRLVLDASAFLSGRFTSIPAGYDDVLTTVRVRDEIKKGAPRRNIENMITAGLVIRDPIDMDRAMEHARSTGDLEALSDADISIIALAIEIEDPVVVTDDFRVQNVLGSIGIRFEPAGELGSRKISEVWNWTFRCAGCGRYFDEPQKKDECPVCGSQIRKKRKR